jgi:hypothetical protein
MKGTPAASAAVRSSGFSPTKRAAVGGTAAAVSAAVSIPGAGLRQCGRHEPMTECPAAGQAMGGAAAVAVAVRCDGGTATRRGGADCGNTNHLSTLKSNH